MQRSDYTQKGFSVIGFLVTIAALGVIGWGVYYLWTESEVATPQELLTKEPPSQESVEATVAAAPTTGEFRSSLPKLVSRGDTLECDWRIQEARSESPFNAGKLWTMGNQGRSQINATFNGVAMEANAIYKDNTAYTWMTTSGTKMGFKFTQSEAEAMNSQMTPQQQQQAEQVRQEMIYNCRAWDPDPAKFVLPTDVDFRSM